VAGWAESSCATSGNYAGWLDQKLDDGGVAMPVVLVHQGPTITQERYDEAIRRLTGGKSRVESTADWPVAGLLVHAAGQGEHGFRVIDVWESEDACRRFGDRLMPILQEVGIKDEPEMYPTYAFVSE
jgi:hypothetical protein